MPVASPVALKTLTVALIGNPNTGKSTLFNGLTGGNARIGNFPGVTVEKKVGRFLHAGHEIRLIDLPGTYSLSPRSADEMVSVDVLLGRQKDVGRPDVVVCIVDAANLERNLYLFSQLRDLQIPLVLVLNMWDSTRQAGVQIDVDRLQSRLGVMAVPTTAQKLIGLEDLRNTILRAAEQGPPAVHRPLPPEFYTQCDQLRAWLEDRMPAPVPVFLCERMLLDVHGAAEHAVPASVAPELASRLTTARESLAQQGVRIPLAETKSRYAWIRQQLDGIVTHTRPLEELTWSDRVDRYLTHKVVGIVFFVVLMFLIFQAIYTWAGPAMELVEAGQGFISGLVESALPAGAFRSLLVDGVIAGVGSVVIFLPQIVLLFAFIAILEDCGYMARAAFLMDKLMLQVGLNGKAFLPLMSSFACAIPGIMATRVIESRRDRMVTILIAPLMSCSARLPVYLLLVGAFVPAVTWFGGLIGLQGLVLFLMQSLGALVAIPIAWLLKKFVFHGEPTPFVMELPNYKWPSPRIVLSRILERSGAFLKEAGTLIFLVTVLIWAAGYFPGDHSGEQQIGEQIAQIEAEPETEATLAQLEILQERQNEISASLIQTSYLGQAGKLIEPAVRPLGWDWRIGIGAIASFPAREVIIATLGTIFSLGGDISDDVTGLQGALQTATWPDGRPLFTLPVALSVMVFFALCAQCGATLMVMGRETHHWRWPVITFVYMTALAYLGSLAIYQVGTALGW